MLILWINLDRSVERRQFMTDQLNIYRDTHPFILIERVVAIPNRNGITGCMLSHFKAIKLGHSIATDKNIPYFAVLEDNFQLVAPINWPKLADSAPPDWMVLQLQTSNPTYSGWDTRFIPYKKAHWGAKIYLVKTETCLSLINYIQSDPRRLRRDADQVVFEGVQCYTLVRPIGLIRNFPSTIANWHSRFANRFLSKFGPHNLTSHPFWHLEKYNNIEEKN